MLKEKKTREYFEQLSLKDLGKFGVDHFGSLRYRLEVARRLAISTNTDHFIGWDNIADAVPKPQISLLAALPGYERLILPALLMAPGFRNGVSVLCAAPPNPVEMKNFKRMKEKLETEIGRELNVRLLYEYKDQLVDLGELSEFDYQKICDEFSQRMQDPQEVASFTASYHLDLLVRYADQILVYGERAYVSPFQCTSEHTRKLQQFINDGNVVLPDIPNTDKAYNNFLLRKEGLGEYLPIMMVVHADGTVVTDFDSYQQKALESSSKCFPPIEENLRTMAEGILGCVDSLAQQGFRSIIKLDSNGVSGLGNLMPGIFPQIYDQSVDRKTRLEALVTKMKETYQNASMLPQFAVVEEFINAKKRDGFMYDLTVGGMMIDGVFMPTSIFPFGTDSNGEYNCGWIATSPEHVGESEEVWKKLFQVYSRMGEVMAEYGYRNGILAGDVLIRDDGRLVIHDYNFRRGGRSTPEVLSVLLPETGWFEVQLKLSYEDGLPYVTSNQELFNIYTNLCQLLTDEYGIYPFSTSFGHYGWNDGTHPFIKLKLLVPMPSPINLQKKLLDYPRNKHVEKVRNLVTSLLKRL